MFTIALIGPDGCGKTTVATTIEKALPWPTTYVYMGVSLESSNLMLPTSRIKLALRRWFRRPSDTGGPRDPNRDETAPKSRWKRWLKFCKRGVSFVNQVAEESYRQLVVLWHLFRGRIVLFDRDFFADYYAYDIAAENRSIFRRMHGWLLVHVYRKPDLVIYLDVSGETMYARKGEGSIDLLNRRRKDYRALEGIMPHFVVVSGEQSLADVIKEVQQHIGRTHRARCGQSRGGGVRSNSADLPLAVVIGADCVTGLQTGRILAKRKIPTVGIASDLGHYCCRTNAFPRILECETGDERLIERLEMMGPSLPSKAVLIPCTDLSVLAISEHRHRLKSWYHMALPSHDTIVEFTDKLTFAEYAQRNGLAFPKSRTLESMCDAESASRELTFPCYLKPAVKTRDWEENTKRKAFVLNTADEFLRVYRTCSAWTDRLLIQEAVVGPESNHYTYDLYFTLDGDVGASFGSKKLRCWPLETGTACLSVEDDNREMCKKAINVFSGAKFQGFAYVEFKQDTRNGKYYVIETNVGRPTGRSAASVSSGVDLPYSLYCDVLGWTVESNHGLPASGKKWVHLRRDLQAAAKKWRSGSLTLSQWIQSLGGQKHYAVISLGDPKPFLFEGKRYLGELCFGKRRRAITDYNECHTAELASARD